MAGVRTIDVAYRIWDQWIENDVARGSKPMMLYTLCEVKIGSLPWTLTLVFNEIE